MNIANVDNVKAACQVMVEFGSLDITKLKVTYIVAALFVAGTLAGVGPASAQLALPNNAFNVTPTTGAFNSAILAEAPAPIINPTQVPTDITPQAGLMGERQVLGAGHKFKIYQKLPDRLWFNATTEASQRYESNVFFTSRHPRRDYVFRILPNVTLGYNVHGNTSVYCNYFVIKDIFANHAHLLEFPTTQSLAFGVRQDMTLGRKTNVQLDFQGRELWQTTRIHQADLLPSVNITRVLTPNSVAFGSILLQLRSRNPAQTGDTREIDPFYTFGAFYRKGDWVFLVTDTLVCNYRLHAAVPRQGNLSMIADGEISHPVLKSMPSLVAFLRAEPIWNWASHRQPGLSGFDFRLFGGLRFTLNKSSTSQAIERLRQQIMETEVEPPGQPSTPPAAEPRPLGSFKPEDENDQKKPAISQGIERLREQIMESEVEPSGQPATPPTADLHGPLKLDDHDDAMKL